MQKLVSFVQLSLEGYLADAKGGINWAKANQDADCQAFVEHNASGEGLLLFGRITYENDGQLLAIPTGAEERSGGGREHELPAEDRIFENPRPRPLKQYPAGERRSRSGNPQAEKGRRQGMAILGSGSIVLQLAEERLIDEFQIVMNPVALGNGRSIFAGIRKNLTPLSTITRTFRNGSVLLCYQPAP